jgi:class 3 adenylate cyclase
MVPTENEIAVPEIAGLPLFEGVPAELLSLVTPDMRHHYYDGNLINRYGDECCDLVVITRGHVRIYVDDTCIVPRSAPAVVGEQALIDQTTRSATVAAQGYVEAIVIPASVVGQLMENLVFVRNLLRIVSAKLREATEERTVRYRNEQRLFGEFSAHVSTAAADRLLATGIDYGEPRYIEDAVILQSDIRNFTRLSTGMSPEQIAIELSAYLSATVDLIHSFDGLVDKFVGDAVLAVWGYTADEEMLVKAFRCAEEMVKTAEGMLFGGEPIRIGVGLSFGKVFSGNIGNDRKRQFTVLGTPVNLAARLESQSKELHRPVVISQALYDVLPTEIQALLTPHPDQEIKGERKQTLFTFDPRVEIAER